MEVGVQAKAVIVLYRKPGASAQKQSVCIMNFGKDPEEFILKAEGKSYQKILDSSEENWMGIGTEAPVLLSDGSSEKIRAETLLVYQEN
jgi:maltooligosyltrehalose trehalohydrolase